MRPFTDPVPHVIAYLREVLALPPGDVANATPEDLHEHEYFVRVLRGTSDDDGITQRVLLDFDTFTRDYGEAYSFAETMAARMRELSGQAADGLLIDRVATVTGPIQKAWPVPAVTRVGQTFRVECRRPRRTT